MKLLRTAAAGVVAGSALLGTAWAGVGLVPVDVPDPIGITSESGTEIEEGAEGTGRVQIAGAGLRVGASKVSMYPRPEDYGGYWERDFDKCTPIAPAAFENWTTDPAAEGDHLATAGSPWPENPNCIYAGGFSIGPMNPLVEFEVEDEAAGTTGLWVRSIAISDGTDTLVLTILDAEGYFWDYKNKCAATEYQCGAKQLSEELAGELGDYGVKPESLVIAATHAHSSPDLIGGWGFVPDWYMHQITDAIKQSVHEAVTGMEEATIEYGEVDARSLNRERRDTYRSAEEQQLGWLRAVASQGRPEVIATVGTYAAHPTSLDSGDGTAQPDWIGPFEQRLEERFGGVGLLFMTGLGNMSTSGGVSIGEKLADLVPEVGDGTPLADTDLTVTRTTWKQPTTNVPLDAAGLPGFFDREFLAEPSSVNVGESATAPCTSASATTVELPATAARFGNELAITASPGEVFSNLTNTLKEQSGAKLTMPIAQANDALGYMPQSFELHPVGMQGLGFGPSGVLFVNYEDSYAVDRCVGDMVLETTITLLGTIG